MKAFIQTLYQGIPRTKAVYCLFCLLIYLLCTALSGGSPLSFFWLLAASVLYLYLPGRLFCRFLGMDREFPRFQFPCSVLCGTGFLTVCYCVTMRLHLLWLLHILPLLLSAGCILLLLRDRKAPLVSKHSFSLSRITPNGWLLLLLCCTLIWLYTFTSVIKNAHPATVGDILLNHDFLWNVGNANSFQMAFPPQDIRFYDVRLSYHYLSEMLAGILGLVTGLAPYDIIAFYLQPILLCVLVACLYLFGQEFYQGKPLPTMLFVFSMFLFSCASLWKILPNGWSVFNNSNIQHLITNINAQTTAVILLCSYGGLFLHAAHRGFQVSFFYLLVTVGGFLLLSVGKGPIAAIVAIATVLTVCFLLLEKKAGWKGLLLAAGVAGGFYIIYLLLFSAGAHTSTAFSFTRTLEQSYFVNILRLLYEKDTRIYWLMIPVFYVLQTLCTIPAQFLLYLKSIGHDIRRLFHVQAGHLFCHACAAGGLLAYFLFTHPHKSQIYFLFLAIFCINVLVCDELSCLTWPKKGNSCKHPGGKKLWLILMAGLCGVGVLTSGFLYIHFFGSGGRQLCRNLGWMEKYDYAHYTSVMTPSEEQALLWLRENTEKESMFATNRIHTGKRLEGISNVYTAFSGRQAFMEGFQYAITNMGVSEAVVNRRIMQNDTLFSPDSTKEEILAICQEHGITHLVYSLQQGAETPALSELYTAKDTVLQQSFPCVYEGEDCRIYATGVEPVPRG